MKKIIAASISLIITVLCFSSCNVINTVSDFLNNLNSVDQQDIEVITEEYYITSPEFDSCYNSLNQKQREIYKKIYSICEEMPKGYIKLCNDYDGVVKDITIAYRAVLNDNADIFWMPDTYMVGKNTNAVSGDVICIALELNTSDNKNLKYPVNRSERDKMRNTLNSTVEQIIASVQETDSQFEKEKFFNDYICANTEYSEESEFSNTSYGCLVGKKALCEGYSRAFKLLCNEVGIECDLIVGKADGEGHMWNSVNIDGKHSFVDVTWNDRPDYPYFYFNITNEQLEFDHTISPLFSDMTEEEITSGVSFNFVERICSYSGNGYYEKYGYVLGDDFEREYAKKAAEFITQSYEKKNRYADFWLKSDYIKNEFNKDDKTFVSNIQKELKGITITSYAFERDILVLYYDIG